MGVALALVLAHKLGETLGFEHRHVLLQRFLDLGPPRSSHLGWVKSLARGFHGLRGFKCRRARGVRLKI